MNESNFTYAEAEGVLRVLHWVRIGGDPKPTPEDFKRAHRLGLVTAAPAWIPTAAADAVLVALGTLSTGRAQ